MNTADSANELFLVEFQRGVGDAKTVALEDVGERLVGCLVLGHNPPVLGAV